MQNYFAHREQNSVLPNYFSDNSARSTSKLLNVQKLHS